MGGSRDREKMACSMQRVSLPRSSYLVSKRSYAIPSSTGTSSRCFVEPGRVYTPRKTQLHAEYTRLIAQNSLILLLKHSNFSQSTLNKIRQDVSTLSKNKKKSASSSPSPTLNFTVIRPGIFGASLRARYQSNSSLLEQFKEHIAGSFAVISSRDLDPPQIAQTIRLIDRAVPAPQEDATKQKKPISPDDIEDTPPKVKEHPSIKLVAAFVDGRFILVDELREVSKLPTLQTLHAQLVGLLNAPGSQLALVLGAASGGSVLRTLQGFQKGLEGSGVSGGDV